MKYLIIIFSLMVLAFGCANPSGGVRVPDKRPSIAIQNAPADAIVTVDGLNMGLASDYDGKEKALLIESGVHKLEVISHGTPLISEQIFLGSGEMKTFKVHSSGEVK